VERKQFADQSSLILERIDDALGDLDLDHFDVDLAGDVLTLGFSDGGKFIINAHSAARQIWLAAGTEAWHFDYQPDNESWVAKRQGDELLATLERVVSDKLGEAVSIPRD
jgi:CyaY protein